MFARSGHICWLFKTAEEREACGDVFARLCEEGTLAPVLADGQIEPEGGAAPPKPLAAARAPPTP
eukprot:5622844-Prymnesium_polylepis.1